jgi:hypothetical protein
MGGKDRDSAELGAGQAARSSWSRVPLPAPTRSVVRRSILTLCLLVAGLLLSSGSALAEGDVGHVFSTSFKGEGTCQFLTPGGVAVNHTSGDVYVYNRSNNSVDRVSQSGTCITHLKGYAPATKGEIANEGIAVDNSSTSPSFGDVYVVGGAEEHVIYKFKPEGSNLIQVGATPIEHEFEAIHGIAVDASGKLWVYEGNAIDQFSNAEANAFVSQLPIEEGTICAGTRPGFAVAPNAEFFYVGRERENGKNECEEKSSIILKLNSSGQQAVSQPGEAPFHAQLDDENTTGVAIDQSNGQIYFDNRSSIAAFSSSGSFIQRFGVEEMKSTGVTVDSATHNVFTADGHEGQVEVFVSQPLPPPPPPPVPGAILADNRAWEMVSPQNKLGAAINGISLNFGVIQASEDGNALAFTTSAPIVPKPPTNRSPEPISNVARRGSQVWSTEDLSSPRSQVPSGYKTQTGNEYRFFSPDLAQGLIEPDIGLAFPNESPLSPEATETTFYWRNTTSPSAACEPTPSTCYQAVVSPADDLTKTPFGNKISFQSATPDAHHLVLKSEVPLTRGAPEEEGLYEWETGGALKLVSLLPGGEAGTAADPRLGGPGEPGGGIMRHAISNDGSRVFWSASVSPGTEYGVGALYMRDTTIGQTFRIDKAHTHQETPGATFQTASADGSKVFFTDTNRLSPESTIAGEEGHGDLYVCEIVEEAGLLGCKGGGPKDLTAEALVRSKSENAAVQGVIGASEDGSYVYFVADAALTPNAAHGHCEPRERTEELQEHEGLVPVYSCNLYLEHYNAEPGHETWEAPKLIAPLTTEDAHSWKVITSGGGALGAMTSRVSPNGRYLAFMSNRPLTGYNNMDTQAKANKARDEEVFLYNLGADRVTCVSCNPAGPPSGVFDGGISEASSEGNGRVFDRSFNWEGRWISANVPGWTASWVNNALYQSRYLSDTGRLYFNSVEPLVPADKNHAADVYQYEQKGEGTCESENGCVSLISSGAEADEHESAFLDASISGNDVFFLTSERLVPQDRDTSFDIYDARVCTTSSPCLTPPPPPPTPCQGEGCKEASATVPAMPGAPPSSLPGPGNVGSAQVLGVTVNKPAPKPETRAQKYAKALKACRKLKKKTKRKACEKQAKKKYGPVAKKGKK